MLCPAPSHGAGHDPLPSEPVQARPSEATSAGSYPMCWRSQLGGLQISQEVGPHSSRDPTSTTQEAVTGWTTGPSTDLGSTMTTLVYRPGAEARAESSIVLVSK